MSPYSKKPLTIDQILGREKEKELDYEQLKESKRKVKELEALIDGK